MYAEQQINAFEIVMELGLAVEMTLEYRKDVSDIVKSETIAKSVKCVDSEIRNKAKADSEIRNKVKAMSE